MSKVFPKENTTSGLFLEGPLCRWYGFFGSLPRHSGEDLSVFKTGPEAMTLGLVRLISGEAKDVMNRLICIYF